MRFSGPALTEGVEAHAIDGVTVRATRVAKTVADGFKFRNTIGLDVAIAARGVERPAHDQRRDLPLHEDRPHDARDASLPR